MVVCRLKDCANRTARAECLPVHVHDLLGQLHLLVDGLRHLLLFFLSFRGCRWCSGGVRVCGGTNGWRDAYHQTCTNKTPKPAPPPPFLPHLAEDGRVDESGLNDGDGDAKVRQLPAEPVRDGLLRCCFGGCGGGFGVNWGEGSLVCVCVWNTVCGRTELAAPVRGARGEHDQRSDGREVDDAALCRD